jgi:hypothetical protein
VGATTAPTALLIDSGANVNIATQQLVNKFNFNVVKKDVKHIKTADKKGGFVTEGSVEIGGIVGQMQVARNATFNLLSVSKLQDANVEVKFQSKRDGAECVLSREGTELGRIARDITGLHPVTMERLLGWHVDTTSSLASVARKQRPEFSAISVNTKDARSTATGIAFAPLLRPRTFSGVGNSNSRWYYY